MVLATFLSHFVGHNYIVVGNVAGYSLLSNVALIYLFWFSNRKYCWFTKLSTLALPLMNLACILFVFLEYQTASYYFDLSIITITVFLTFILSFNKK